MIAGAELKTGSLIFAQPYKGWLIGPGLDIDLVYTVNKIPA